MFKAPPDCQFAGTHLTLSLSRSLALLLVQLLVQLLGVASSELHL